jgi:hypothetical protein
MAADGANAGAAGGRLMGQREGGGEAPGISLSCVQQKAAPLPLSFCIPGSPKKGTRNPGEDGNSQERKKSKKVTMWLHGPDIPDADVASIMSQSYVAIDVVAMIVAGLNPKRVC